MPCTATHPPTEEVRKRCAAVNSRLGTKMAIADSEVGSGAGASARVNEISTGRPRTGFSEEVAGASPWAHVVWDSQGREGY